MSTSAILPSKLTEFALGAQNRFAGILVGAAVLAIVGLAAPHEVLQKSLLAAATALIVLCGVLYGLVGAHGRRQKATLATLSSFIDKDAVPGFLTRADGEILSRNQAARSRFQGQAGDTLIGALDRTVADPAAILSRLQTRADTEGFAQEELVTRKGHIRVGVNKAGANAYAWRFEDVAVAAAQNDGPALPMILVGRTNAILYMNDPARDLVGGRVTSLERLFKTMPVQSGTVCDIEGVEGPARVLVSEVSAGAGRKALYLLPPGPASVRDDEWNVFENLPVPLLKVGADGQVQAFNLMASNLIGIALERDVHLSDLMEGLGRSITDWLTDTLAGRASQPTEFLRLKRTDKEVFVQVTLNRISESGDPTLIAVLSDATELKSLEAQFVQSQKMQAIGQLAGGVAHDFNNLLTAISGHCDLLLLRHDQGDPDFSDLVQINQNANRAAALVGQLLAFSRKQTLRPETLDMRDTLADLTHLLNRLVGEKVTLTLTHDPVLLPIRADKRQLEQVLMNLVVNARDAMPNGGEIRIETQCIRLKAPLNRDRVTVPVGEYVTVHVSDDGIGIPSDKLQKVFEPFYTTKRTGEGTGLGLSTAYGIVKQTAPISS